jgi:hypothetical protein
MIVRVACTHAAQLQTFLAVSSLASSERLSQRTRFGMLNDCCFGSLLLMYAPLESPSLHCKFGKLPYWVVAYVVGPLLLETFIKHPVRLEGSEV